VRLFDGTGQTLVPGLIDAHTHAWNEDQLRAALVFGVTTELDMMAQPSAMKALKQYAQGHMDVADVRSAGAAATAPGGHGTEYGFKVPTLSAPAEAQRFVDARIAEGSDYIKII
jgi:hypothetical protein